MSLDASFVWIPSYIYAMTIRRNAASIDDSTDCMILGCNLGPLSKIGCSDNSRIGLFGFVTADFDIWKDSCVTNARHRL